MFFHFLLNEIFEGVFTPMLSNIFVSFLVFSVFNAVQVQGTHPVNPGTRRHQPANTLHKQAIKMIKMTKMTGALVE